MKTSLLAVTIALALGHGLALAETIAPSRYINAQGVEIIHDRGSRDLAPNNEAPAARKDAAAAKGTAAAADPRLTIAPAEQAARDSDRIAILQEELQEESRAYANLWSRLNGAGRPDKPSTQEIAALNEKLVSHQKNIQALNEELRRAQATRGALRRLGAR